jgi:putative Mg2+ transporter-C (MgtC) family protein
VIFDLQGFLGTLLPLSAAFILGGVIGLERQIRQRNAGLRTMVLVSVGAAAFVHLGGRLTGGDGETRVLAYVVSGIGFLGAGVIMKEGSQVRGLNTAATLWSSAAVGAFAGAGLLAESAAVTVFVLAGNTLLRPLVNAINRRPMDERETEALYQIHLICAPADVSDMRDLLSEELERANYPIQSMQMLSETDDWVELSATLVPTTANADELDAVIMALQKAPGVESATWTVSAIS